MIDFKEKYKASKPGKKFLVFNTYSLLLALIFFIISYLVDVLFSLIFGAPKSLTLLSGLVPALLFGYIMCFLALYTRLFNDKKKEGTQKR